MQAERDRGGGSTNCLEIFLLERAYELARDNCVSLIVPPDPTKVNTLD